MTMEKAVFITNVKYLDKVSREYSRLYFGTEFCERRIPSEKDLALALAAAGKTGAAFTLATPYVTDAGLSRVEALCKALSALPQPSEVVVNDWGVLHMLNERFPKLVPVLGRLLNKQKRCPTLARVLKRTQDAALVSDPEAPGQKKLVVQTMLPRAMDWYYKGSNAASVPVLEKFLLSRNVRRIELDNVLQGLRIKFPEKGMSGSLHVPFVYISTTFYCLTAGCDSPAGGIMLKRRPCSQECQKYTFTLSHGSMPREICLKGNTQFYRNDAADLAALEKKGIDRIVYSPVVPV